MSFTNSGASVLGLTKFRPLMPLIAFSPKPATLRKLALVWGWSRCNWAPCSRWMIC